MTTIVMVDTNVVIDLLDASAWRDWSLDRLLDARRSGNVLTSAIVIGELAIRGMDLEDLLSVFLDFGMVVEDLSPSAAYRAGLAHAAYRAAGGTRERLLGDFLIGAHAQIADAQLLTRDDRYYRRYFPTLPLITPETHP